MSVFNPFAALTHFSARTYKTTFWGKIKDTFFVFSGYPGSRFKNNQHAGIIDYLTLGILALLSILLLVLNFEMKNRPIASKLIETLVVLSFVPRVLFALPITLSCLPFIALAHIVSMGKGQRIKESILNSQIPKEEYNLSLSSATAPANETKLQDSFLFEEDTNQFFYINEAHKKTEIKVNQLFKHSLREKIVTFNKEGLARTPPIPVPYSISHAFIKRYLIDSKTPLLERYLSVGKLLKSKDIELEDFEHSVFAPGKNREEMTLSFEKVGKCRINFFLSSKNTADCSLFQNIRTLNIGEIEETIENSPAASREILTPFMAAP